MLSRRTLFGAAGLVGAASWAPGRFAFAQPAPHTIEELTRHPEIVDCSMTPNGQTVAVLKIVKGVTADGEPSTKREVHIQPFLDLDNPRVVELEGAVDQIGWANDDTLALFTPVFESYSSGGGYLLVSRMRLTLLDRDSDNPRDFEEDSADFRREGVIFNGLLDLLPDEPNFILGQFIQQSTRRACAYRIGISDNTLSLVERGDLTTVGWETQNGTLVARINSTGRNSIIQARGEDGEWRDVRRIHRSQLTQPDFDIVGNAVEPGVVLVAARAENDDVRGLYEFDLKTLNWGTNVSRRSDLDVVSCVTDKYGRYLGAGYYEDRISYDCADPTLTQHLAELNGYFTDTNVQIHDISNDTNRLVCRLTGPREAGHFIVFDRAEGALGYVGAVKPWLNPNRLAVMQPFDVRARDGMILRSYLTIPAGEGPHPLVVMPHGGPEVRDYLKFDVMAQAFATQGWLVLQPNFRGSDGFGRAFAEAGHKQWAGSVMDDIEDSVAVVLQTGIADRNRIAIAGASFGGYAALMGGIQQPDVYKAIVAISAPADLAEMLRHERGNSQEALDYWSKRIGDLREDSDLIRRASPQAFAESFQAPVLLLHGSTDSIVPVEQSRGMATALRRERKEFEYIEIPGSDHSAWSPEILQAALIKSIDFIQKGFDAA
jgi:dienelactone hydrolase